MNFQGSPTRPTRFAVKAFSLMELLVVMAIVGVLSALLIPSISRVSHGYQLSAAAQSVVGELMLARQNALTKGTSVQIRFYKLPDYNQPETTSAPTVYRGFQCFLEQDAIGSGSATLTPMGKPLYFNSPIQILDDATRSTLLTLTASPGDRVIPRFNKNYSYISFRYKPNGQTDLSNTANCITLVVQHDAIKSNGFPANFATIKIDSPNGTTQTYRP